MENRCVKQEAYSDLTVLGTSSEVFAIGGETDTTNVKISTARRRLVEQDTGGQLNRNRQRGEHTRLFAHP
jgi:hypothetical protein